MRMTFKSIFFGGLVVFTIMVIMVVFMPDMMWAPERTLVAHPYSDIQAKGRKLFAANGCNYCHTQYVREYDTGMGAVAKGGDYAFDYPMLLGSERTGPDLSHIGRKRSEAWEIAHLRNPRRMSPMSIMPSFEFLSDHEAKALAAYLFGLGDRVAHQNMILPPDDYAHRQSPEGQPKMAKADMSMGGMDMGNSNDSGSSGGTDMGGSSAGSAESSPADMEMSAADMRPRNPGGPTSEEIKQAVGVNGGGWAPWLDAHLQEGKLLYVSRCLTCHGCAGNGLGSYGGTLTVTPANFKQQPFKNMPPDQWFWHVSEGVQGTVMPPWRESLTELQRWRVIRYVRATFAKPAMRDPDEGDPPAMYAGKTNPVPLTIEALEDGKAVFTRECLVCHGDAGRGHGPYAAGLQPSPPDFGDGSYGDFTDADFFWRVSEGLPWSAMPAWRVEYGPEARWKVVHYLRSILTLTQDKPEEPDENSNFRYPDIYKKQRYPADVSFERGKKTFLVHCAHCHGLALDGKGWDGDTLKPTPADFREMRTEKMTPEAEGEHLAKVTFGIMDTAMPSWGEFLPLSQRWDAIKFLMASSMMGKSVTHSVRDDTVAPEYVTLNRDNWTGEGHVISMDDGRKVYATYCATCHGQAGMGDGPGTKENATKGPAPLPKGMDDPYVFWRVAEGVPGSVMPPMKWELSDEQMWNVTAATVAMSTHMPDKAMSGSQDSGGDMSGMSDMGGGS